MKENIKISILSVIVGAIQMILFLPDGYSCIDGESDVIIAILGESDVITAILYDMPIQFCIVLIYSLIFKPLESSIAKYILLLIVLVFWLYVNRVEFLHREECWSTFLKEEINPVVVYGSIIPCSICIFAFYIRLNYFQKKKKQKTTSFDKKTNSPLTHLSIIISFLLISCNDSKRDFEVLHTEKVADTYQHNPDGFIKNNYGKLLIKTISRYNKEGKLKEISWNRANGFLRYTLSELKEDPALLNSFDIDTMYSAEKYIGYIKEKKNDTIFYLSGDKVVIYYPIK